MRVLGPSWVLSSVAAVAIVITGCQAIFQFDDDLLPGTGGAGGATTAGTGGFGGMVGTGGSQSSTGGGGGLPCNVASCPDTGNECVIAICEIDETCGTMNVADGTPVAAQVDGNCKVIVCDGAGATRSDDDDADIFDDGQSCTTDTCAAGSAVHTPVALDTACTDDGGLYCNAAGACVECNDGTQCTSQICQADACAPRDCGDGFQNGNETALDCGGPDCGPCGDGLGCLVAGDCQSDVCNGATCEIATCIDGVKNGNSGETDVDCGGGTCAACADNFFCATPADCFSGVCIGMLCTPGDCIDGVQNGTETDVDCGGSSCPSDCANGEMCSVAADCTSNLCTGSLCAACTIDANCPAAEFCSAGVCVPDSVDGTLCSAANHCASGNCADGVCCDTLCSGTCLACTMALKGAGADGLCGAIANNTDPQNECASAECKTSFCSGSGACGNQPNLTNCGTPLSCSGTTQTQQDTCNANGACIDNLTVSCAPYACGATSCKASCTINADCSSGNYCSNGNCTAQLAQGIGCNAATAGQCASGNCVDQVCCNNACSGGCDVCLAALGAFSNGTCTNLSLGVAGNPSCAPYVCSGSAGACPGSCTVDANCIATNFCSGGVCIAKKTNGSACVGTNQCVTGNCVDGFCCNSVCGGACDACSMALGAPANGTCSNLTGTSGNPSCTPYLCGGAATCPSSCTVDANCIAADYCSGSSCVAKKSTGTACAGNNQCVSGTCSGGLCT